MPLISGFFTARRQIDPTSDNDSHTELALSRIVVVVARMSRDPFPMSSQEAKDLAGPGGETGNWNSMATSTNEPVTPCAEEDEAAAGLVGKNNDDEEEGEDDDVFLDRPLWESRASGFQRVVQSARRFGAKAYRRLYGDQLPVSEMLRTLCLGSTLFFMIGGYWLLRSLKDAVLTALCGVTVIPKAKMLSVVVVLGVVSIYNHLLDSNLKKHQLFYIFGTFYFGLFLVIALLLQHPTIGLANEQPSPSRILGWLSYCSIESFGSVMVSLFWSFANSNTTLETAKASYGVMVALAQIGSILGPTVVNFYGDDPARCYMMGAFCMLLLQGTMRIYIHLYGVKEETVKATTSGKPKAGITEGLVLFWKHNYVKGIFAISCLFMVEVTIVDFTLKLLGHDFFAEQYPCAMGQSCWSADGAHGMSKEATAAFTQFLGFFGQATNTLSFLMSFFGTSAVIRALGLRLTLLLFPSLCLAVIIMVRLQPTLYVVFGAMMALKACSYALNNPTKEILYQPTSSSVRYKAKSWIDIFGARGSKAMGSVVTNAFSHSATELVANGSLVGMAVASFLIWNARFMGRKFDEYTESGYVVGEEASDAQDHQQLEMAMEQAEVEDTSCAIPDDDDVGPEEEGQERKPEVTLV